MRPKYEYWFFGNLKNYFLAQNYKLNLKTFNIILRGVGLYTKSTKNKFAAFPNNSNTKKGYK